MKKNLKPQTLFDKIWSNHLVDQQADGTCLIYIDRHLVHEVTSPQAFEGLRDAGRSVRRAAGLRRARVRPAARRRACESRAPRARQGPARNTQRVAVDPVTA